MKALSVGLIKGNIDEVDQKVQMTWVQPRVLDLQQVSPPLVFTHFMEVILFVSEQIFISILLKLNLFTTAKCLMDYVLLLTGLFKARAAVSRCPIIK